MDEKNISYPNIVSHDEWLSARKELLVKEKEATRARDALNAERRRLPMVEIDKDYTFEGPHGKISLLDMFDGRDQLIVQHFMFGPTWKNGCSGCSDTVDELSDGLLKHLNARNTSYVLISRAPHEKIEKLKDTKEWNLPWYSSYGSDFNYDFHVTLDESVAPLEYNYRSKAEQEEAGPYFNAEQPIECPGYSFFLRNGDRVFHTYSTYARGAEMIGGSYYFLDLTALGRQEDWEEPKGRVKNPKDAVPNFSE